MNDIASWSKNRHNIICTYGIGFYIKNDDYFNDPPDKREIGCSHSRKWDREQGWTQCLDCYKILETKKSLLMGLGEKRYIDSTNKLRGRKRTPKKPLLYTITEEQYQNFYRILPSKETIEESQAKAYQEAVAKQKERLLSASDETGVCNASKPEVWTDEKEKEFFKKYHEKPKEFNASQYVKQTEQYLKGEIEEDQIMTKSKCEDLYKKFYGI